MKTKDELREAAVAKWNADIPMLDNYIREVAAEDATHELFMWGLVWQEVVMYILLDRQVEFEDYQIIVDRRGFNEKQRMYLKEMLIHIGIGEILSGQAAVLEAAEKKALEAEKEYTKIEMICNLPDGIKPEDVWFPVAGVQRRVAPDEK